MLAFDSGPIEASERVTPKRSSKISTVIGTWEVYGGCWVSKAVNFRERLKIRVLLSVAQLKLLMLLAMLLEGIWLITSHLYATCKEIWPIWCLRIKFWRLQPEKLKFWHADSNEGILHVIQIDLLGGAIEENYLKCCANFCKVFLWIKIILLSMTSAAMRSLKHGCV